MTSSSCPLDNDNQTVFTFFSEFNDQWPGQTPVECILMAIIFVTAVVGNVLLLLAIIRNRQLRTTTNLVIASLAMSDLLMVAGLPFILVTRITRHWIFGKIACKALVYAQFLCGISSILSLAFISVERYLHVKPSPGGHLARRTVMISLTALWLVSFAFPAPVAIAQTERILHCHDEEKYVFCGAVWPEKFHTDVYLGSMVVIFFIAPLLVVCVFYTKIFLLVRRSAKTVTTSLGRSASQEQNKGKPGGINELQLRLIKMSVTIVVAFLLMLLPFFVCSFLGVQTARITSSLFTASLILALSNTALNPIVYGYFSTDIRREFKAICTFRFNRAFEQ